MLTHIPTYACLRIYNALCYNCAIPFLCFCLFLILKMKTKTTNSNLTILTTRLASHSLFSDWTGAGEKRLVTLGYSLHVHIRNAIKYSCHV